MILSKTGDFCLFYFLMLSDSLYDLSVDVETSVAGIHVILTFIPVNLVDIIFANLLPV
jgi:hypothetical protein